MGAANLSVNVSMKSGVAILECVGDIDAHTSSQLRDVIDKNVAAGNVKIVFDFSKLNYISSAGIGVLNAALNTVKSTNGKMAIAVCSDAVRDTLEVMYFHKKVDIHLTVDDAVKRV
jgi:anti-sigma B factor antagonist